MADILIRMEMPKSCVDCHDADLPTAIAWLEAKCPWAHGIIDPGVYDLRHGRHPDCPLHELPPHGDLIDRDALIKVCNEISAEEWNTKAAPYSWAYAYESFVDDIEDISVVVPAEKGEK